MKVRVSKKFKFLYDNKQTRINIFYGGRAGGKTTEIKNFLLYKTLHERNLRILCLREFQVNLKDSVYHEFLKTIHDLNLDKKYVRISKNYKNNVSHLYSITTKNIINKLTNSEIIFYGINDNNVMNIKSFSNVDICWVEEAHFLNEKVFNILEPTLRKNNSFLLFSFNPQYEHDFMYKMAVNPIKDFVTSIFINYNDNPFLPDSMRKSIELSLKKVELGLLTQSMHDHIWHGKPIPIDDECIFNAEAFKSVIYDYDTSFISYTQVVLGIDPATTNKDYSNETGIILCAKTKDEIVHVLGDYSGKMTPNELSNKISDLYTTLRIDVVVIEVNNGGDFIKSAILNKNPYIPIIEVRATREKRDRAYPIAVLMGMKKILLLDSLKEPLFRQMRKMTNQGYMGEKGESPDRLEAMEWGVYHLFNINETNTINTIFHTSNYNCDVSKAYIIKENIGYGIIQKDVFCVLFINLLLDVNIYKINFTQCIVLNSNELKSFANNSIYFDRILFKDNAIAREFGLNTYHSNDLELLEKAYNVIAKINNNINVFNVLSHDFKGYYGNHLIKNLNEFCEETKDNIIVECFCDVILDIG